MAEHILIGPGKFGLGFAGDLFARVGRLKTLIVSRSADRDKTSIESVTRDVCLATKRSYRLRYDRSGQHAIVRGVDILQCDFISPTDQVIAKFADDQLRVVSVSVPESGLESAATLLARGLEARLQKLMTSDLPLVLVFVNIANSGRVMRGLLNEKANSVLRKAMRKSRDFMPDCVVDRICASLDIDNKGVIVDVERYAALIVKRSHYTVLLQSMASHWRKAYNTDVLKEVSNIEAWSALKYWGLNGLHIVLASVARTPIYSKHEPYADSDVPLSRVLEDPRVRALVDGFISEVSLAVRSKYPRAIRRDEAATFLTGAVQRVSVADDTADRMLTSLRLDPWDLANKITSTPLMLGDKDWVYAFASNIIDWSIGEFLKKVETRLLNPTFHLSGKERMHPLNLAIGTSSVLYSITARMRRQLI